MMKGITNAELRKKLEYIENELKDLKYIQKRVGKKNSNISFLGISTIWSLVALILYVLIKSPTLLFFIITGILSMIFFVTKMFIENKS
jgi:hypothetical protein